MGSAIRRRDGQRGVITIELLLLTPMVALVLLAGIQVSLVMLARNAAEDAARAAARASTLNRSPTEAAQAALGGVAHLLTVERVDVPNTWAVGVRVVQVFPGASIDIERKAVLP